jgi:hypothetical protein
MGRALCIMLGFGRSFGDKGHGVLGRRRDRVDLTLGVAFRKSGPGYAAPW